MCSGKTIYRTILAALFLCSLTACGKKGALIYPDMLAPAAPADVTARQAGSGILIMFRIPEVDRAGRALNDLAGVRISRRESESGQDQFCRACTSDYRPFRTLYLTPLPDGVQRFGNRFLLIDSDVGQGKTYSYRVVPFSGNGGEGNAASTVPTAVMPPLQPPVVRAEALPTEIRLFLAGGPEVSAGFIGYNLYRASPGNRMPFQPLNGEPLKVSEYIDSGLSRDVVYRYQATSVFRMPAGELVESQASNEIGCKLMADD